MAMALEEIAGLLGHCNFLVDKVADVGDATHGGSRELDGSMRIIEQYESLDRLEMIEKSCPQISTNNNTNEKDKSYSNISVQVEHVIYAPVLGEVRFKLIQHSLGLDTSFTSETGRRGDRDPTNKQLTQHKP
jgi:hypothetical protein